ncbi:MAG: hypothetical protein JW751_28600 [Polyangiaceae bacterium]|nr:hypothetical protein [Polyangiaceae bacterium]
MSAREVPVEQCSPASLPVCVGATTRFLAVFQDLTWSVIERKALVIQSASSLAAREHTLITRSRGTAKSRLASAIEIIERLWLDAGFLP